MQCTLSLHYERSLVDWTCITVMFHHISWQTLYIHWPTFQKRIFIHFLWRQFSAFSMAVKPAGVGVEAIVPPAKLKLLFYINELHFWRWMLSLEIYLVRYISAIDIYIWRFCWNSAWSDSLWFEAVIYPGGCMHAFHKLVFQVFSAHKTINHKDFQRTAMMHCLIFTEDTYLVRTILRILK